MEDRETARMRKYGESKTTRIMMATVPNVTSGLGLKKFQADGFLLTRVYVCMYISVCKTFFCVVRHLDSIVSYLPTGLHFGFFRSWPLFLPSSFSSVFLVLSFVLASTSMIFWANFLLPFFEHTVSCELVLFNLFYNCFL